MSQCINCLHSHSGLERELRIPKHIVLVDAKYAPKFLVNNIEIEDFYHNQIHYVKVPILAFVEYGGVFKNLNI